MDRLTTNKNVSEMGMYELAHNACYSKEGLARYRDYEMDMDARDFARNLMTTLVNEDMPIDDELFDEEIIENLIYDPFSDVKGLIALFYRNLWAMADLREKLAEYEDAEEQGLLLRLPCKVGTEVWKIEKQFWIDRKGCKGCIYFGNDGLGEYCDYCEDDYPTCTKIVPSKFTMRMLDDFGKTVFLTKEEAEQALEAMKGGGEC